MAFIPKLYKKQRINDKRIQNVILEFEIKGKCQDKVYCEDLQYGG